MLPQLSLCYGISTHRGKALMVDAVIPYVVIVSVSCVGRVCILKIIDTIGKTHDTESIFSWDAFKMCSIDLTYFHSMLTGLSDRY